MEEFVGIRWHRLITRFASQSHPAATVNLAEEQARLGMVFRALGGDPGLRVEAAPPRELRIRRRWLERIAGTGRRHALAWRDGQSIRVPERLAWFGEQALNRDLYLWLVALASRAESRLPDWFAGNQHLVQRVLSDLSGLTSIYRRLVFAVIAARPDPARLPRREAARERAIQAALRVPGSRTMLPDAPREPWPVPLWLYPAPAAGRARRPIEREDRNDAGGSTLPCRSRQRRRGEYVEDVDGRSGLIVFRLESLFSWSEYISLDRTVDDGEDRDAQRVAEDLDKLSLTRKGSAPASRIKLDLDLPAASEDDIPLTDGRLLPEWDWRRRLLRPRHCRVIPLLPRDASPRPLPAKLASPARRLRSHFRNLRQERQWQRRQPQGRELDLAACIGFRADQQRGNANSDPYLWRTPVHQYRDLACLVLADLSLSTESQIDPNSRIIDVIRDSLHLLGEALDAGGDRFAMYGFSSRQRDHVRFTLIKNFAETWGRPIHGRIHALRPGYYTRMGAAIRQAHEILAEQPASQRLLLLLSDGKPNDLDRYEGRYGLEDTRHALDEARRAGIISFCVTIEQDATDYLPYLFGRKHYKLMRRISQLPELLPPLYLLLTEGPL
ncbi:MAG: VWA domain-containing protein [Methylohalobius crimeensis]